MELCKKVLEHGHEREDRTGTGTLSLFGEQLRFDLTKGFPSVTTKKLAFKTMTHELIWFLSGDTNIKYLQDNNVKIWDAWADENGNLGSVYGEQWRNMTCMVMSETGSGDALVRITLDQIGKLIHGLKDDPQSRRHIVNAWNAAQINDMALPPCHMMFQCYVHNNKLSLQLYQRSADLFLGVPFNITSYALLTHMLAQVCSLDVGELIISFGDVHIYKNHIKQMKEQLARSTFPLPEIWLNPEIDNIDDFTADDIKMIGYKSHAVIKGEVSV